MKMPRKLAKKPRSWSSITCQKGKTRKFSRRIQCSSASYYDVKYLLNRLSYTHLLETLMAHLLIHSQIESNWIEEELNWVGKACGENWIWVKEGWGINVKGMCREWHTKWKLKPKNCKQFLSCFHFQASVFINSPFISPSSLPSPPFIPTPRFSHILFFYLKHIKWIVKTKNEIIINRALVDPTKRSHLNEVQTQNHCWKTINHKTSQIPETSENQQIKHTEEIGLCL